jgi:hypothetical protein
MLMHSLYRFYSGDETLLYVGQSCNPFQRLTSHIGKKDMPRVRYVEIEWFDEAVSAIRAEQLAICREGPLWNQDGRKSARQLKVTPRHEVSDKPQSWPSIPADVVKAGAEKWHMPDVFTWQAAIKVFHDAGFKWVTRATLNDNIGTRSAPKSKEPKA